MLWNILPDMIKSAKNDRQFKIRIKDWTGFHMLLLNMYIGIVNKKISWPVLVLNYFFF